MVVQLVHFRCYFPERKYLKVILSWFSCKSSWSRRSIPLILLKFQWCWWSEAGDVFQENDHLWSGLRHFQPLVGLPSLTRYFQPQVLLVVGLLPTFVIWSPGSTSLARLTPMMAAPFNGDADDDLLSLWHGLWWCCWRRGWLFSMFLMTQSSAPNRHECPEAIGLRNLTSDDLVRFLDPH